MQPLRVHLRQCRLYGTLFSLLLLAACSATPHEEFQEQYERGIELSAAGRSQAAIEAYRMALAAEPRSPDAHNNLGAVLYNTGQTDAAITEYGRALQLRPSFAVARNNLGVALLSAGRTVEAVSQFRQAVELNASFVEALFNLCLGLEILGQIEEALNQCRHAAQLAPAQPGLGQAIERLEGKWRNP